MSVKIVIFISFREEYQWERNKHIDNNLSIEQN